jgi:ATP-binding cassette, subfamily B (MDR/TAP), member 1
MIGYVPQRVTVFPDTIAANITYGLKSLSPLATQASIEEAARLAGINTFINSLPAGYETRIGEGGLGLSTGQIQRIGIARAVVRQPKLLIMDEPTSNLDSEVAAHVRNCVRTLVQRGTTVVVATHSIEMMQALDRLVVIEAGQATEEGSWAELTSRQWSRLRYVLEVKNESRSEFIER